MSSDKNDRAQDVQQKMDAQGDRMEGRLDELDEHVEDADRKAEVARELAGPGDEPAARAVTGDDTEEGGAEDDPTATVNQPGEADDASD